MHDADRLDAMLLHTLRALVLALAIGLTMIAPALAQSVADEADTAEAPPVVDQFSAGERLSPSDERKEGDWTVICFGVAHEKTCGMSQPVFNAEGNNVAQVELFRLPDNDDFEYGAIVVTPLETWLEPGLILRIDNGDVHRYPYRYCFDQGCVVQLGLTQDQIDSMRLGLVVHLRLFKESLPDAPVDLQVSLTGFTGAIDSL